ncbi:cytochrome P450 [Methylorubrum sp. SB2]|uniref:cytochrome P450 n=1 Tax=Methylorubrum subtropicum TaxID=3138812 RepID=UPI00313D606B
MSVLTNLFRALAVRVSALATALTALARLAGIAIRALTGGQGTFGSRLAAALLAPGGQVLVFSVLRVFRPNLVIGRSLIKAYENTGTAIVTRHADVQEVLAREADFAVVYEPRMRMITGGSNFFLGMADTPDYTRDVSLMRLAMRREDVSTLVAPFAAAQAERLVAGKDGRIDVPQALSLRVPAKLVGRYFGTPGPTERAMIDWTTTLFWYLFLDLNAAPAVGLRAREAAAALRAYLDETIQARKASEEKHDDVLGRCLALQASGTPGADDTGIRDNLIGLLIGAVPTTSKAACQALDALLDRPEALAGAMAAARADDDAGVAAYVFEALRFAPVNPVIYRRALRETVIARSTLRACTIPEGTMVFAANLSAMFDPLAIEAPDAFRTDRPWEDYILWGEGLHTCFGAHVNRVLIPAILKPLLARPGLRRAAGPLGRIDTGGTPFPVHFVVAYDAEENR